MKQIIKALVAVALVASLLYSVDLSEVRALAGRLHWWALAVVLGIMIAELLLSTWKWSRALLMHDLHYQFGYLARVVATGFFLNNFLPTSIGGDAYRVYRTVPREGYRSRAVSAVLVDRATGFGALLTLGAIGSLFKLDSPTARAFLLIYVTGVVCGLLLVFALHYGWLRPLTNRIRHLKAFDAFEHNVTRLRRARGEWLRQIALSLVFQATSISIVYWLFMQTGATVPIHLCAMLTAAAGMAALIPLSLNGIGLMEGSLVVLATALGVPYDQAVLVSLVRRMMMLLVSLLCGLVYLAERNKVLSGGTDVTT